VISQIRVVARISPGERSPSQNARVYILDDGTGPCDRLQWKGSELEPPFLGFPSLVLYYYFGQLSQDTCIFLKNIGDHNKNGIPSSLMFPPPMQQLPQRREDILQRRSKFSADSSVPYSAISSLMCFFLCRFFIVVASLSVAVH